MCNRTRKLKVSFYDNNEAAILRNLGQDIELGEIKTLELEVPDTKETYEYLVSGKEVLDWEFLDSEGEETQKTVVEKPATKKRLVDWDDEMAEIIETLKSEFFPRQLVTSAELLTLITEILTLKKKSPALRFTKNFIKSIKSAYLEARDTGKFSQEEIPILYFLDGYNSIVTGSILEELLTGIHRVWNLVESEWTIKDFVESIYDVTLGTGSIKLG